MSNSTTEQFFNAKFDVLGYTKTTDVTKFQVLKTLKGIFYGTLVLPEVIWEYRSDLAARQRVSLVFSPC